MLIVSGQKLKQLRALVEAAPVGCSVLLLKGPSGSGKTEALNHVCAQLDLPIHSFTGAGSSFSDFVNRLPSNGLTVVLGKGAVEIGEVQKSLAQIDPARNCLFVFLVTEGSRSDFFAVKNFHPTPHVVQFSPFSETAILKLLSRYTLNAEDPRVVEIARNTNGDARQALNQLHACRLFCKPETGSSSPKRKRRKKDFPESPPDASIHGKDTEFSFFHIIGKILYNKEGVGEIAASLSEQPVIADSGPAAILTLHENIPDFTPNVTTLATLMHAFSFADLIRFSGGTDNRYLFTAIAQLNPHPTKPGTFQSFRKSNLNYPKDERLHRLTEVKRALRWADWRSLGLLHVLLKLTEGRIPAIPDRGKQAIFNLANCGMLGRASANAPVLEPFVELSDDPLEEC